MPKYWLIFIQSLSEYSAYRLQIIISIFQSFMTPLFMLVALSSATSLSAISSASLLPYYLFIALIYPVVYSNVDEEINALNTSGEINNFLIKPISLYKYLFFKGFSQRVISFISALPLFIPIYLFLAGSNHISPHPGRLLLSVFSLLASFFLIFSFSFLIGLLSFWIDEFWAIHNVKYVIIQFFGGVILPYTFFPQSLASILKYSPFPYMVSWTPRIIQGTSSFADLPIVLAWSLIFILGILVFQKQAIRKYSFTAG